jgi:hypothetical protein
MTDQDQTPRRPAHHHDDSADDRYLNTAELMIGTTMMFVGFLNVFLSISGGFEISIMPMLLYFGGMAVWAHAVVKPPAIRYAVMGAAIVVALAFFHFGEVLFWHKQVVFWCTVLIVVFFMFRTSPNPS